MLHAVRSAGDDRFHRSGSGIRLDRGPAVAHDRRQRYDCSGGRGPDPRRARSTACQRPTGKPAAARLAERCRGLRRGCLRCRRGRESRRVARRLRFGESARSQVHRADPNHSTRRDQPRVQRPAHRNLRRGSRRLGAADGIVAGLAHSETASVKNITETLEPRQRTSPRRVGLRAISCCDTVMAAPSVDHGATRSCEPRVPRRPTPSRLRVARRHDQWTILDIFVARIFGSGDFAPYLGA